jgi:triacylglycerol lipase
MFTLLPPGYDNRLALRLAGACSLAYRLCDDPVSMADHHEHAHCADFFATSFGQLTHFGFLMSNPAEAVVAFRGSLDFVDALANFRYLQEPYPFAPEAGSCHGGFLAHYASLRGALLSAVRALPAGLTLYVTGHSLGGGIATLAALDLAVNTAFNGPVVYTFGAPRVGDPEFAARFDATLAVSWRVVNAFDLVPLLPPEQIFDPLAVKKSYSFQHVEDVVRVGFLKGGARANHSLVNYIEALEQLEG